MLSPRVAGAAASLLSLAGSVIAHGGVVSFSNAGTTYPGWQAFNSASGQVTAGRPYSSFNPILNPTDSTMACNDDGTAGPSQQTITVAAGSVITDSYSQWTHAEGPYTVYLAACPSSGCTSVNTKSGGLKWFKIYELGLISGTVGKGSWANGKLMANLKWDTTIPANLKPGDYFIRWETLALHQSNTPQFYPECAQLHITGSGTEFPSSEYLVSIPGAWGANDPGVNIDIYSTAAQTTTTYLIPGPRVYPNFTGYAPPPNLPSGSGGSGATSAPSGGSTTTAGGSPPSTTSSASGPAVSKYGQCGGTGYTGSTNCVSGTTCTGVSVPYYYQCL